MIIKQTKYLAIPHQKYWRVDIAPCDKRTKEKDLGVELFRVYKTARAALGAMKKVVDVLHKSGKTPTLCVSEIWAENDNAMRKAKIKVIE